MHAKLTYDRNIYSLINTSLQPGSCNDLCLIIAGHLFNFKDHFGLLRSLSSHYTFLFWWGLLLRLDSGSGLGGLLLVLVHEDDLIGKDVILVLDSILLLGLLLSLIAIGLLL